MGFFDSMTTSALTNDDEHYRMVGDKPNSDLALISSAEILEWCESGLLLPLIANLDSLDMGILKTLIGYKTDFFGSEVPSFSRHEVQKAMAWALSMVHTGRTKDDKTWDNSRVCTREYVGDAAIPPPSYNLVQILLGKAETGGVTMDGEKAVLINAYGRPTQAALTMLGNMETHNIKASLDAVASRADTATSAALKRVAAGDLFGTGAGSVDIGAGQVLDSKETSTIAVGAAIAQAKIASGDLNETLAARLQAQGFSKDKIVPLLKEIGDEIEKERYTPDLLAVEGESASTVINALKNLNKVFTSPDAQYDAYVKRMVLIRRLLTGEDVGGVAKQQKLAEKKVTELMGKREQEEKDDAALQAAKSALDSAEAKQRELDSSIADNADNKDKKSELEAAAPDVNRAVEAAREGVAKAHRELDAKLDSSDKSQLTLGKITEAAKSGGEAAMKAVKSLRGLLAGKGGTAGGDDDRQNGQSSALPPLVVQQLLKVRDFQVGLATKGEVNLRLDKTNPKFTDAQQKRANKCALDAIIASSHYWLTSGLFVQSGALGKMENTCSIMSDKLYSYSSAPNKPGFYTVSKVRKALANTISETAAGQQKIDEAAAKPAETKPAETKTAEGEKQEEAKAGGGSRPKKRGTRRRRKKESRRRGKKKRRSRRHARKGGAVCPVPNPLPVSTSFQ